MSWQDLAADVAAEFAGLQSVDLALLGGPLCCMRVWRPAFVESKPAAELLATKRASIAKARAARRSESAARPKYTIVSRNGSYRRSVS